MTYDILKEKDYPPFSEPATVKEGADNREQTKVYDPPAPPKAEALVSIDTKSKTNEELPVTGLDSVIIVTALALIGIGLILKKLSQTNL